MEKEQTATRFAAIFNGLQCAYGTYTIDKLQAEGKRKGRAQVLKTVRTTSTWIGHLSGKGAAIGIVPINEDDCCVWGCIDIDTYSLDHHKLIQEIRRREMPLVVCRSKSGGAHCFLFTKSWISAKLMQDALTHMSAVLGYGGSEIFPKQIKLYLDRGDVGNFLNLPYYDAEDGMRYGIQDDGTSATLEVFFEMYEKYVQTPEQVEAILLDEANSNLIISDGPPCLQTLCQQKIGEGSRNNGLFNVGVYLRKAFPDTWDTELMGYNQRFFDPPLPLAEVMIIAKQLQKKDYTYKCKDAPINAHCNSTVCRTRKYGVGDGEGSAKSVANLRKYNSTPPVWFVDVNGVPVELDTEALMNQAAFQKTCVDQLNSYPRSVKRDVWENAMNRLLKEMTETEGAVIDASQDSSITGQFYDLLEDFCTAMQQAESREEILLKRPFTDEETSTTMFRLKDFQAYLNKNKFNEYKPHKIAQRMRDIKGSPTSIFVKGKAVRIWEIPSFKTFDKEGLATKTQGYGREPF